MISPKALVSRALARLDGLFGRGLVVSMAVIVAICVALSAALFLFIDAAAPTHITIATGPPGSVFHTNAEKYKTILARDGVILTIVPSDGSVDNLRMLRDPRSRVDVGFVLGGGFKPEDVGDLMSLGSVSYQPLMVFCRGQERALLSGFAGKRLGIGPAGSGTHALALTLLKANGIEPGGATALTEADSDEAVQALARGELDAIFLMGDSTSMAVMRKLLHDPDIHLFSFSQADGYVRRIHYLNKLTLPRGALDFGKDVPAQDTNLIGPTVELIARGSLHPALSDLLLEAAREVHGTPALFRKRREFPAAVEHEIRLSPDAVRYYTSGKTFLYRTFPFWLASWIARTLAVLVPLTLLLIPALRAAPAVYRWRMENRIHRWYRVLLELERDAFVASGEPGRREELLHLVDELESKASKVVVPAAFGDLFYALRVHIGFVRDRLQSGRYGPPPPAVAAAPNKEAVPGAR